MATDVLSELTLLSVAARPVLRELRPVEVLVDRDVRLLLVVDRPVDVAVDSDVTLLSVAVLRLNSWAPLMASVLLADTAP